MTLYQDDAKKIGKGSSNLSQRMLTKKCKIVSARGFDRGLIGFTCQAPMPECALFRKCFCYDGDPAGQTAPVRGQLSHPEPGCGGPPGGCSGDASGSSL